MFLPSSETNAKVEPLRINRVLVSLLLQLLWAHPTASAIFSLSAYLIGVDTAYSRLSQVSFIIFPCIPSLIPRKRASLLLPIHPACLQTSPNNQRVILFNKITRLHTGSLSLRSTGLRRLPIEDFVGWLKEQELPLASHPSLCG